MIENTVNDMTLFVSLPRDIILRFYLCVRCIHRHITDCAIYSTQFIFCFLVSLSPISGFAVQSQMQNISTQKIFNDVQDKLVIVEGDKGRGSGFIAIDRDGVKYFYTNKHVVEGQRKITAKLLNGQEINLSVAVERSQS